MTDISRLPGPFELYWGWQTEAACRGADSSLFFHPPGERGGPHDDRDEAAKQVCAGCPVRAQCLEYALAAREPYGVWGGLSEDERQTLLGPVHRTRRTGRAAPRRNRKRAEGVPSGRR
ncbi:WhiB family transcriptional regulator [Kitasatospora sp. NPDC094015]|uniref:WhiB family transcriptional regulator n=1 Tax=Kitasatospora sp. NPDC094015 TaxID=3155205 RepID=UPI00332E22CB